MICSIWGTICRIVRRIANLFSEALKGSANYIMELPKAEKLQSGMANHRSGRRDFLPHGRIGVLLRALNSGKFASLGNPRADHPEVR